MKYKLTVVMLAILFFLGLFLTSRPAASDGIHWYPYGTGMEFGKKENKKIFLHFWAEWCDYCKQMARETFTDSAVIAYLNKYFISIKVNSDKEQAIASDYNVRGLPDNWFIDEKNVIIGNHPGYIPPDKLLPQLRFIHTDSYKKMSYSKFLEMK